MANYKIVRKTYSNGVIEYWCYRKWLLFWHHMVENVDGWDMYQVFNSYDEALRYIDRKITLAEGKKQVITIISSETVWERKR